jgi:hypothetical protein
VPSSQVVCHADVQRAIAAAGKNVDEVCARHGLMIFNQNV